MPNFKDAVKMRGTTVVSTDGSLPSPTITSPNITFGRTTGINLASANVTLTTAQAANLILEVTTGSGTYAIIAPNTAGKVFIVVNKDASNAVTIKKSGGTGVTIAAGKTAIVYHNGTDYARVTADAS